MFNELSRLFTLTLGSRTGIVVGVGEGNRFAGCNMIICVTSLKSRATPVRMLDLCNSIRFHAKSEPPP